MDEGRTVDIPISVSIVSGSDADNLVAMIAVTGDVSDSSNRPINFYGLGFELNPDGDMITFTATSDSVRRATLTAVSHLRCIRCQ